VQTIQVNKQRHQIDVSELSRRSGNRQMESGRLDVRAKQRLALATADLTGFVIAFVVAELTVGATDKGALSVPQEFLLFLATLPFWILAAAAYGLYGRQVRRADHKTPDELVSIFHLTTIGTWVLGLLFWMAGLAWPDPAKLAVFWLVATVGIPFLRALVRTQATHATRGHEQTTVIIGARRAGQLVARKILAHPEYGLNVLCFVDPQPAELDPDLSHIPVLHSREGVWELVRRLGVDRAILSYSSEPDESQLDLVHDLRARGIHVDVVPRLFDVLGMQAELHAVEGLSLVGLPPFSSPDSSRLKRALDVVVSAVALLLLLPVFAAIGLALKLESRGPVFYRSERIGKDGGRFHALKFRTMDPDADRILDHLLEDEAFASEFGEKRKLTNDPRVTRLGRFLRRSSLDELPQFVNVLRGDMSLVGPRPVTVKEFEEFPYSRGAGSWTGVSGYWNSLACSRPGLTGLWQINGRSTIRYSERVRLDQLYASNWSLGLDLVILAKTVRVMRTGDGAL
jgi:exopolysaccharide biosynthesis polyprenyl glycosylphosphotransferase